jgi:predicted PurR-regulated permease PerM
VGWCFEILRPFILPVVWGIILATAIHPAYDRLAQALGGRSRMAAGIFVLLGMCLVVTPFLLTATSFVDSAQWLADNLADGTLKIPPPPEEVAQWPLIGDRLYATWSEASMNIEAALQQAAPHLAGVATALLSTAAGVGIGLLQFIVSIIIAGILMANSASGTDVARAVATRFAGQRGQEFAVLASKTVRGVAAGIVGVALLQSFLFAIGFFAVGVPHAALWAGLCLLLAVIQLPPLLVIIPIIVWVFSENSTPVAMLFMVWSLAAALSENWLKPMLMSRGLDLPMIVIFMGALGGFVSSGFVGLFVGAVVLALGYELFMAWLKAAEPSPEH